MNTRRTVNSSQTTERERGSDRRLRKCKMRTEIDEQRQKERDRNHLNQSTDLQQNQELILDPEPML